MAGIPAIYFFTIFLTAMCQGALKRASAWMMPAASDGIGSFSHQRGEDLTQYDKESHLWHGNAQPGSLQCPSLARESAKHENCKRFNKLGNVEKPLSSNQRCRGLLAQELKWRKNDTRALSSNLRRNPGEREK